jgi:hypothetical protein
MKIKMSASSQCSNAFDPERGVYDMTYAGAQNTKLMVERAPTLYSQSATNESHFILGTIEHQADLEISISAIRYSSIHILY